MNKSRFMLRLILVSVVSVLFILPASARKTREQELPTPKYVFLMVGDGMGINEVYGAQNYNKVTGDGPEFINFTLFPVRTFVTTHSASSLVTDSSASGTAFATGVKTYNNALGVDPDHNPVSSICVWAHEKGFGTGIATNVGINHATPGVFYGHADHRNQYEKIANQLIEADFIDFAAGSNFLTEEKNTGHKTDYFEDKAREAGIGVFRGREQFHGLARHKGRVICLGDNPMEKNLKFAMDRKPGDFELSDFVNAGIDYLYGHFAKKGFFFMIEGGQVDNGGHNNDAICNIKEVNDFAKAIDVVLAFYEQHPDETLILVTADHETGGLQLGENYIMHPELLTARRSSEGEINKQFKAFCENRPDHKAPTWDQMKDFLKETIGLWGAIRVSPRQEELFREMFHRAVELNQGEMVENLYSVSNRIVSDAIVYADKQAGYLWSHGGHTGSPVGLYVKGARAADFNACKDNAEIPIFIRNIAQY